MFTTEATRRCDHFDGDGASCSKKRHECLNQRRKSTDLCWLEENFGVEQEMVAEDIDVDVEEEQEQETASSPETPSPNPISIYTHPDTNPKGQTSQPLLYCRQIKRKAAATSADDVDDEDMFQVLLEYQVEHNNTLVPQKYSKYPEFGEWVQKQRYLYSKKLLPSDHILRLESIGFVWSLEKLAIEGKKWESMFQLLRIHKTQQGNKSILKDKPQLQNWVQTQRKKQLNKTLRNDRIRRLESIGFKWVSNRRVRVAQTWEVMYELLLKYKSLHGDTLVPRGFLDGHYQLGNWAYTQKFRKARGDLPYSRVLRLESIGFVWSLPRKFKAYRWESMFQLLLVHKAQNSNTLVSVKNNPSLRNWVHTQRRAYSRKTLFNDRICRLDSIGFRWPCNK